MIFDLTKNYAPDAYTDSRDYRVFLRQLGILTSVFKYNIDHFMDLYDADSCPEHLLPLLASMVGYNYNEDKSISSNRKIIKAFPYLIRNRGSELGLKLATVLSINTSPGVNYTYSMDNIVIETDPTTGVIDIYYPENNVLDWELIEVVRPIGTRIHLKSSGIDKLTDTLDMKVTAKGTTKEIYDTQSKVNLSQINYDQII